MQIQIDPIQQSLSQHDTPRATAPRVEANPTLSEAHSSPTEAQTLREECAAFEHAFSPEQWRQTSPQERQQWRDRAQAWVTTQEQHYAQEFRFFELWLKEHWNTKAKQWGFEFLTVSAILGFSLYSLVRIDFPPLDFMTSAISVFGGTCWLIGTANRVNTYLKSSKETLRELPYHLRNGQELIANDTPHPEARQLAHERFTILSKMRTLLDEEKQEWFQSETELLQELHTALKAYNPLQVQAIEQAWREKTVQSPSYTQWTRSELKQWIHSVGLNEVKKRFLPSSELATPAQLHH